MSGSTNQRSRFWDESVARSGHTGYADALLHRYDQPIRLTTVHNIIRKLYPGGLHGMTVLDIGCGTGDFINLSASLGAAVVEGIDVSPRVLAKAADRFAGNQRIELQCGTVIDRVTQPEHYDLISSITVLQHHVSDEELIAALVALRVALKPGGRLIVLELAPPQLKEVDRQYSRGLLYLVERPPKAWYAAFEAAGLTVVSEPVMPQFGIACLRGINWMAGLLLGRRQSVVHVPTQDSDPSAPVVPEQVPPLSLRRRLRRKALEWVRATMLVFCYPLDHWLRLPLPPARFRTYRVFVLGKP